MRIVLYTLVFLTVTATAVTAQNPKGKYGTFALTHASVETVTKGVISNGTVVIQNGKITAVGTQVEIPQGAEIIDCRGQWIFPGLIDGGTNLGLTEIGSDPRTHDYSDVGDVIPQMRALTAINPNSTLIPVTRIDGVTTVIAAPSGGLLPGTAALIHLFGYTPDQMYAGMEGLVLEFPSTARRGNFDRRTDDEVRKAGEKSTNRLNDVWDKAEQYHKLDSAMKGKNMAYYPELQAILPVLRGERPLMIEVNKDKDIQNALAWVKTRKIKKVILCGVAEGWRVADEIAKANVPVVTGPILALPTRDHDRYDKAYANAGLMHKAGVKVAIRTTDAENVRRLPYHAGFAAAYGMGREEALRAITMVPAEIFGVADKLGSIEPGKTANLVIADGDILEAKTNIRQVFIGGWMVPMVSRQTQLYEEFLKREPGAGK